MEGSCAWEASVYGRGCRIGTSCKGDVARRRTCFDASLSVTGSLKEVVTRVHGECELRVVEVLNIGQVDLVVSRIWASGLGLAMV